MILDDVVSVSVGYYHTVAIRTDGSLWAWGHNSYGQLGDASTTQRLSPIKIMDGVVSVTAGQSHTLAIKADGSLWGWGNNSDGYLGDGTTTRRISPVKIMDDVIIGNIIPVINVLIDQADFSIYTNNTKQLTATINPTNASNTDITWSSSDTSVATINAQGVLTALSSGVTTISVTTADGGHSDTITVTVAEIPSVTSITIDQSDFSIPVNKSVQLSVTINPSDAPKPIITWSSNDTSIATINEQGYLTPVSTGIATITATTSEGIHTDSVIVTVTDALPPGTSGNPVPLSRYTGASNYVVGDTLPTDGYYYSYTAESNTTITLISPHENLRFRVETFDGDIVFDSDASNSGAARGKHGFGVISDNDGYVQKINTMDSVNKWTNGTQYKIAVYSTSTATPSTNGIEYYLFVGSPVSQNRGTHDIIGDASVSWLDNEMRISYSLDVLSVTSAYSYTRTPKVTLITITGSSTLQLNSFSYRIQRLQGGVNQTGVPRTLGIGQVIEIPIDNASMSGSWMFTLSGTIPSGQSGNAKPRVHFFYNYEIGD